MRAALLFLLAFAQDPSVQELVRSVGDDSIEIRDKAAAELVRRGEPNLAELRKAAEETGSAEVRARLGDVVAAIEVEKRRREFKGGAVVGGLCARLEMPEEKEPSLSRVLKLEIMNMGPSTREIAAIRSWDRSVPRRSSRSSGSEAQVRVVRLTPEPPGPYRGSMSIGCGGRPVRTLVVLKPGESRTFEYRLFTEELAEAEYEVAVDYYSKTLLGADENLRSNAVRFTVSR